MIRIYLFRVSRKFSNFLAVMRSMSLSTLYGSRVWTPSHPLRCLLSPTQLVPWMIVILRIFKYYILIHLFAKVLDFPSTLESSHSNSHFFCSFSRFYGIDIVNIWIYRNSTFYIYNVYKYTWYHIQMLVVNNIQYIIYCRKHLSSNWNSISFSVDVDWIYWEMVFNLIHRRSILLLLFYICIKCHIYICIVYIVYIS